MSNIAIKGATTGTGVFTLESPATNTDRTLVLPDEAGTVLTSASDIDAAKLTGVLPASIGKPLLVSTSVSSGTVIELPVGYQSYEIIGQNLVIGTPAVQLSIRFSTSNFSSDTVLESSFSYQRIESAATGVQADNGEIRIATNMGAEATDSCSFWLMADNLTNNNTFGYGGFGRSQYGHGGDLHSYHYSLGFRSQSTGVFKYMQISASTGTLNGTVLVYGVGT